MGLVAVAPAPNTSRRHPQHQVYPYLLRGMAITQPDHVWCADVTYIPMAHGFLYLVAMKYECVYLNAFDNMKDAKEKLDFWIEYYNHERPHSSLNDQTPNEVYEGIKPLSLAA